MIFAETKLKNIDLDANFERNIVAKNSSVILFSRQLAKLLFYHDALGTNKIREETHDVSCTILVGCEKITPGTLLKSFISLSRGKS